MFAHRSRRLLRRHPWWAAGTALGLAGLAAFVLLYFAPQDLFLQTSVDEPLPVATSATGSATGSVSGPTAGPAGHSTVAAPTARPAALAVLGSGRFRSGEHDTSGTAKVLRLPDGR